MHGLIITDVRYPGLLVPRSLVSTILKILGTPITGVRLESSHCLGIIREQGMSISMIIPQGMTNNTRWIKSPVPMLLKMCFLNLGNLFFVIGFPWSFPILVISFRIVNMRFVTDVTLD